MSERTGNDIPNGRRRTYAQGRYWILTIPRADWNPGLPEGVSYVKGQLERGNTTGFEHWQFICYFNTKVRLSRLKSIFGDTAHAELTRSEAAETYCSKEDSRIEGTEFEFGRKPFQKAKSEDWEQIWEAAKEGRLDVISGDIKIRYYGNIKRVAVDHCQPCAIERKVYVFWGPTQSGKSRRAWREGGLDAYPKDPRSKFWDGYNGQVNVIIDEFRGAIDISHILRWCDRYPVIVEVKGASVVLKATTIWITSNLHPKDWYPGLDKSTLDALIRRLEIHHITDETPQHSCGQHLHEIPPERSWQYLVLKAHFKRKVMSELLEKDRQRQLNLLWTKLLDENDYY